MSVNQFDDLVKKCVGLVSFKRMEGYRRSFREDGFVNVENFFTPDL